MLFILSGEFSNGFSFSARTAIAGMLGHAGVITTGIYARIVDKIAENPARYLEELIGFS